MLFPPGWMAALTAVLSGGAFTPVAGAITDLIPTLGTPPGTATLTLTGLFAGRAWFSIPTAFTVAGSVTITPRPSGDALNRARALSAAVNSVTLTANGFGVFLGRLAPFAAGLLGPKSEGAVNNLINSLVATGVANLGLVLSPTSIVSARRVTIAPSGMATQLVLADLLGPAVSVASVPPKQLNLSVAPTPQAGVLQTCTITATETATGVVVPGADVGLHNYPNNGPVVTQHKTTDALGHTVFAVTLERRLLDGEIHGRDREKFVPPTLTVSKAGFASDTRKLL